METEQIYCNLSNKEKAITLMHVHVPPHFFLIHQNNITLFHHMTFNTVELPLNSVTGRNL